jgi:hypothetical protein
VDTEKGIFAVRSRYQEMRIWGHCGLRSLSVYCS